MTPKPRGLGRGLNALFEDEEGTYPQPSEHGQTPGAKRQTIGIDLMRPGAFQPRTLFNEDSLNELAQSIKTHGLLQPIVVRPLNGGLYEIIAGERRWRASQRAGLHDIPAIIMELTDTEALEIALVENLQREDLNPVDEAMGYKKLMDEFKHTQEQLAEALGKSRSHVANMVRLLALPDVVLAFLERGDLTAGHARALITAEKPEALAKEIVARKLSVRETERLVASTNGRAKKSKSPGGAAAPAGKDVDTLALEREISNIIGMSVSIDSRNGQAGKLFVEFKSLDQLDDLIARLSRNPGRAEA